MPIYKVQRLQVDAAAARDVKHAGVLPAVEGRALPTAPDREVDLIAASDRVAKGKVGTRRDIDTRVAPLFHGRVDLALDVFTRVGVGLTGEEWRQR